MYTTAWCGYCGAARQLLEDKGIDFDEIGLDGEPYFRQRLVRPNGGWTVPQVLIDNRPVGGYTELRRLDADGSLDELVAVERVAIAPNAAAREPGQPVEEREPGTLNRHQTE